MMYKAPRRWLLVATTFVSSAFFLVTFVPPEEQFQIRFRDSSTYEGGVKRTRAVQAVQERPSSRFSSQSQENYVDRELNPKFRGLLMPYKATEYKVADSVLQNENMLDVYGEEDIIAEETDEEVDDYDDLPENDIFENGDFDYNDVEWNTSNSLSKDLYREQYNSQNLEESGTSIKKKRLMQYKRTSQQIFRLQPREVSNNKRERRSVISLDVPFHRNHVVPLRNVTLVNSEGIPIVEDNIYWSKELEEQTPTGITDVQLKSILYNLRHLHVRRVEPPTWNRCGRPKNQFVVFEDGSEACARYRYPHQYLVQGEVMSFYLSRLLGIWNVPVVTLAKSGNDAEGRWSKKEVQSSLQKSEWESNTTVALIQWIDNLERDKMPPLLLWSLMNGTVLSPATASMHEMNSKKLVELLQWSDLVIFDYITGNYDRVASMQDAADKERKPSILNETIHNLVRSRVTDGLWLIDNESGLLDSYSLLYERPEQDGRFLDFHQQMLRTICLFRRSTAERVSWLHQSRKAGQILLDFVQKNEPLFSEIHDVAPLFKRLQERVDQVHTHMMQCSSPPLKLRKS